MGAKGLLGTSIVGGSGGISALAFMLLLQVVLILVVVVAEA